MSIEMESSERGLTWRDLRDALLGMDPEDPVLDQMIQILPVNSSSETVRPLLPAIAIGTLGWLLDPEERTRSNIDNQHHPEQLVILLDSNVFCEDGSIGEDLMTGQKILPHEVDDASRSD